jgi:hypothetical protein
VIGLVEIVLDFDHHHYRSAKTEPAAYFRFGLGYLSMFPFHVPHFLRVFNAALTKSVPSLDRFSKYAFKLAFAFSEVTHLSQPVQIHAPTLLRSKISIRLIRDGSNSP